MGQKYTHLSAEERAKIEFEEGNGSSLRSVARRLGRHASSVSRELSCNRSELSPPYSGPSAGAVYRERWWRSVRAFLAAMARIASWQDQPQHPQSPRNATPTIATTICGTSDGEARHIVSHDH